MKDTIRGILSNLIALAILLWISKKLELEIYAYLALGI